MEAFKEDALPRGQKAEYRRIRKMERGERAKQFAPFSPLSGFYKALASAEKRLVYSKEKLYPDDTPVTEFAKDDKPVRE